MANPQKENGYTAIADEILEALSRRQLSGYEWRCLILIVRKTYGFHKKEDWIALSQFIDGTGIGKSHVCRALRMLVAQNIVTKGGTPKQPRYSFQKDYDRWKNLEDGKRKHSPNITKGGTQSLPKGAPEIVTKGGNEGVPKGVIRGVPKGAHTKDSITKDTITRDIADEPSDDDSPSHGSEGTAVADIIDVFVKGGNKNLRFGNITQRESCKRLIAEHGIKTVLTRARYAVSVQTERYAPNITTPLELEQKMHKLETYYKREHKDAGNVAIIS